MMKAREETVMLGMKTTMDTNTTGVRDIADSMGGGIQEGALVLIEGDSKSGKSVLSQHMAYGVLCAKDSSVAYYTLDENIENLITQMESMSLETKHDYVTDRFRIYNITISEVIKHAQESLQEIVGHVSTLPSRFKLIVIDSVAPLLTEVDPVVKLDFLQVCKDICEQGRSIVLTVDTHSFNEKTLLRAYNMSDYYLKLRSKDMILETGQVDNRVVKILEVRKLAGAERKNHEDLKFEIKPKVGIQILPFVKVKI